MINKPSPVPPPQGHGTSQVNATPTLTSSEKPFHYQPMNWLGYHFTDKQTETLMNTIIKAIGREIDKEKQKMIKAMRKMREDQETQDNS